jgi:hypothetical protein
MQSTLTAPAMATHRNVVIVIDHAGARVFLLEREAGATPQELHHVLHHADRSQHDADRAERYPADTRFFDAIAAAVAGNGRVVVIGHGKGQSNEADHLMAHLGKHHTGVQARVAGLLSADLPHSTVPQLLALARHALWPALKSAGLAAG